MATAVKQASENGGMVLILNQSGHVIFSPQTEGIFRVQPAAQAQDLRQSDNTELAAFVTDALKSETGVRRVDVEGWSYYMVGTPSRPSAGRWTRRAPGAAGSGEGEHAGQR